MIRSLMGLPALLLASLACGESVDGVDRMLCAAGHVKICTETGECFDSLPEELDVPEFVILDLNRNTMSTTSASHVNRRSRFSKVERSNGLIRLQGLEGERAFSFVIDEMSGRLTAAVSGDGFNVSVYGACTDADVR